MHNKTIGEARAELDSTDEGVIRESCRLIESGIAQLLIPVDRLEGSESSLDEQIMLRDILHAAAGVQMSVSLNQKLLDRLGTLLDGVLADQRA